MSRQQRRSLAAGARATRNRTAQLDALQAQVVDTRAEAKAVKNPTRAQRVAWRRRRTLAYAAMRRL